LRFRDRQANGQQPIERYEVEHRQVAEEQRPLEVDDAVEEAQRDLATLLPLVDRFGGLCFFVLAMSLTVFSPWSLYGSASWYTMLFGRACPTIAALVPALPMNRATSRYITVGLGVVSLLAPMIILYDLRYWIVTGGAATLNQTLNDLLEFLQVLPFLVAGLFAVGAMTLPTTSVSIHARTRVALLTVSAHVVLIAARDIWALWHTGMATEPKDLPWLAAWLIRLVAPKGTPELY
jgi:hypothetical protein